MPKSIKKDKKDKKSKSKKKHKKDKIKKKQKHKHSEKEKQQDDFSIPVDLMNRKSHAPETPEEYKKRSEALRREVDPVTGRTRLIRGEGEILEEIVSKDKHKEINKAATDGDGRFFQEKTIGKK